VKWEKETAKKERQTDLKLPPSPWKPQLPGKVTQFDLTRSFLLGLTDRFNLNLLIGAHLMTQRGAELPLSARWWLRQPIS